MWRNSGLRAARAGKNLALAAALVASLALVGGCASLGWGGLNKDSPVAEKQAAVGKRAEERWNAVIRGDFAAAYGYFSAASREVIRPADFAERMGKLPYRSIRTDKVECEAEVCTVSLTLTYDNPAMKMTNVPTMLQEKWLIERGDAWFVFRG